MKNKFFLIISAGIIILTLALSSCIPPFKSGANTDLGRTLTNVPAGMSLRDTLWFDNLGKMKQLGGIDASATRKQVMSDLAHQGDLIGGYILSEFSGGTQLDQWAETFSFNAFDTNQEIWADNLGDGLYFSVMKGKFDTEKIAENLNQIGYQQKTYKSAVYYSIREDFQIGKLDSFASRAFSYLNRLFVEENTLIAAPSDAIFQSVFDTCYNKSESLQNVRAYKVVSAALGEVLGAALVPQPLVKSDNARPDWGKLHNYQLAGIGYRVEGQQRKVLIALYYPDQSAPEDVQELIRRLSEYTITKMHIGGYEKPVLSAFFDIGEPVATVYSSDSTLTVELTFKSDVRSTISGIWSNMVKMGDISFLVVDPSQ